MQLTRFSLHIVCVRGGVPCAPVCHKALTDCRLWKWRAHDVPAPQYVIPETLAKKAQRIPFAAGQMMHGAGLFLLMKRSKSEVLPFEYRSGRNGSGMFLAAFYVE